MAYIGVQPTDTYLSIASQQITGTGSATYTLDYSVSNEEDVAVFVNNVRQNVSTYTVSGTSLTLGGTISASDSCWVLFLGRTVGTKTPAVGSVTNDMLAGSIANSKLANSSITVNGTSIDLGASGTISAGITMIDQWRLTSDLSGDANPITANLAQVNTDSPALLGTGMSVSSGIFTFPSTGLYQVIFQTVAFSTSQEAQYTYYIQATENGSTYGAAALGLLSVPNIGSNTYTMGTISYLFDVTNTSTHKVAFRVIGGNAVTDGSSSDNRTAFYFIRLGDT